MFHFFLAERLHLHPCLTFPVRFQVYWTNYTPVVVSIFLQTCWSTVARLIRPLGRLVSGPDFQYTISPSKSLKTKASSISNNNNYYSGNKKNNNKMNNHLNNNNYVKQNVNMSKTFSPTTTTTTTTIAKKKYNRKKQLAMTTLPKMSIDDPLFYFACCCVPADLEMPLSYSEL